jgi:type I restriction enzyme R subunit
MAWRAMTNQGIATRGVGYMRQAAIGAALVPYAQRVASSLQVGAHHTGGQPGHANRWRSYL